MSPLNDLGGQGPPAQHAQRDHAEAREGVALWRRAGADEPGSAGAGSPGGRREPGTELRGPGACAVVVHFNVYKVHLECIRGCMLFLNSLIVFDGVLVNC